VRSGSTRRTSASEAAERELAEAKTKTQKAQEAAEALKVTIDESSKQIRQLQREKDACSSDSRIAELNAKIQELTTKCKHAVGVKREVAKKLKHSQAEHGRLEADFNVIEVEKCKLQAERDAKQAQLAEAQTQLNAMKLVREKLERERDRYKNISDVLHWCTAVEETVTTITATYLPAQASYREKVNKIVDLHEAAFKKEHKGDVFMRYRLEFRDAFRDWIEMRNHFCHKSTYAREKLDFNDACRLYGILNRGLSELSKYRDPKNTERISFLPPGLFGKPPSTTTAN
jgi:DNA repair exonuclease SbcCD ATPase subunit